MANRIDFIAPATITVLGGDAAVSSLSAAAPFGISLTDPDAGDVVTVTVVAGNSGASLSAGSATGVSVSGSGNHLTITGTALAVSAALTSLQVGEPGNVLSDTLVLTASDAAGSPAVLPARTAIAVNVMPAGAVSFSAPVSLAVQPNAVAGLPGLALTDPAAAALAAAWQGRGQTIKVSLSVGSGVLLLPGYAALGGISVTGIGTGNIALVFTADQLGAVNGLLAGLSYAGPGQTTLSYAMSDISGPLGAVSASGSINLSASGSAGVAGTFGVGIAAVGPGAIANETLILGGGSIGVGTVLDVSGNVSDLGGIGGGGAVWIAAGAALELPYDTLSLSGTSYDFGTLGAAGLNLSASAVIADGANFSGPASVGANGLIDFAGTLIAGGSEVSAYLQELSLGAGALLTGDGTLVAGNYSDAGEISGPGTLLAGGGETLLVAAGSISGAAHLEVAAGGVLVLGPVAPLFGVFNATAETIDSSVTLGFTGDAGVAPLTGGYADSLAEDGGVVVLNDPQVFGATITGFAPGDLLVFPGLSGLMVLDVTNKSFVVAGENGSDVAHQYTIDAVLPVGMTPIAGVDAQGDGQIGLRDTGTDLFVNGASFNTAVIDAGDGVGQPALGLQLLPRGWTTQSLTLTLSVGSGVLTDGSLTPGASLVLTEANPTALDAALSELVYTASLSTQHDILTVSSGTGFLAGLSATVGILIEAAGTVSGFGVLPTAAQSVLFAGSSLLSAPVMQAAAPGQIVVTGAVDFADQLAVGGIGGTALLVDAGGAAVFDAASSVALAGNVTIGDAGGAGTLGVITDKFVVGVAGSGGSNANLVVAGSSLAAGSVVEDTGAIDVNGNLIVGAQAAARLDVSGYLSAVGTTIDAVGTLVADASPSGAGAAVEFGGLVDTGSVLLADNVHATAANLILTGTLALGGTAELSGLDSAVIGAGGSLVVGPDSSFGASGLDEIGGGMLVDGSVGVAGNLVSSAGINLGGGILSAAAVTLGAGAVLSGFGDVVVAGAGLSKIVLAGGDVLASGGILLLDGDVTMSGGSLAVSASSQLDLVHGVSGGSIVFDGVNGELVINDVAVDSTAVAGMVAGDVVDLVGVAPGLVTYSAGLISVTDTLGDALGGFGLGTGLGQPAVEIISDGSGGALITLGGEMPCFARGTRLLTPNGYVPVEAFKPGDPIITHAGERRAVRWIGRRTVDAGLKERAGLRPVLVMPGAMGPGQPGRPVRLSPSHAVFVDGVLVPVTHLVNGATIVTEVKRGPVIYYHVELDRHDVVVADGLPVETYLDTGNRGELYREVGRRGSARQACAELVTRGAQLAKIRRRLHEIAIRAGFTLRQEPALRGMVGDVQVAAKMSGQAGERVARFTVGRDAACMTLMARCAAPADTDPDTDDRRQLGICVRPAAAGRLRLGAGWYEQADGDAGVWMGPCAEVFFARGEIELSVPLAAVAQSWRRPAAT